MTSQARDRRNHSTRQITSQRDICVYKEVDNDGHQRLIIKAPEPGSLEVAEMIRTLFTVSHEDLANDFQRSAMLIRAAIYLLAAASESLLLEDMRKIGTDFDNLYHTFRQELQKHMAFSFEMFEMFVTACYHYFDGKDELGAESIGEMQQKWTKTQNTLSSLSRETSHIRANIEGILTKLQNRRNEVGSAFEIYATCIGECMSGVMQIRSFLTEQEDILKVMHNAFNLEERCAKMRGRLNGENFRQLINDATPQGLPYEIGTTILRCVALKRLSESYTKELTSKRAFFTQMVSASPSPTTAQQNLPFLIKEFSEAFPAYSLNKNLVEKIQSADWSQRPPPERRSWCSLM